MTVRKIEKSDLVIWAGAVTVFLALTPDAKPVREFAKGLIGLPTASKPTGLQVSELRAELAQPALFRELDTGESKELFEGMVLYLHGREAEALPILGKFALLGDVGAQSAIGSMYYFGKGLPPNRDEGIRWLSLAARQGGVPERQALAAALSGTWEWDNSNAEPEMAYAPSTPQELRYAPALPEQARSRFGPGFDASIANATGGTISPSPALGARASVEQAYGSGSAGRRYSDAIGTAPQIGAGSPEILNRAGPGTYSDGNGDIYTQAGPHGVVNTRTGEFSPTN
jgi:hypothetical protein